MLDSRRSASGGSPSPRRPALSPAQAKGTIIATHNGLTVRTSEPADLTLGRVREILAHREILMNLVRKELKVKYTASVLGAIWSLLNPVVFLAVFSFVSLVLGNSVPNYPVYLLAGLLPWNVFSVSITQAAQSVLANSNLVKKVAFPREILPLSAVGVALVDFGLQMAVLWIFILVTGYAFEHTFTLATLGLFPLATVALLALTIALALLLSALNVRYRDIQHLLNIGLLVWFWATPIVYASGFVQETIGRYSIAGINAFHLYLLNPLVAIVGGFQRALYGTVDPAGKGGGATVLLDVDATWLAGMIGVVLAASLALLWASWRTFFRLSGDFAEEL